MFRINRKVDYAVRVMLCLARRQAGARLNTQVIQDEMLIPGALLHRIIADLSRCQLIRTFPGPGGGAELARPAENISLRHVWEAIEGPLCISECLLVAEECPFSPTCPVLPRWARIQSLLVQELEATTLAQLASEAGSLATSQVVLSRST